MFDKTKMEQVNFYQLKPKNKYVVTDLYGVFHYIGTFDHGLYKFGIVSLFKITSG